MIGDRPDANLCFQSTAIGMLERETAAHAEVLGLAGFRRGGDGMNGNGNGGSIGFDGTTSAFTSGVATPASGAGGGGGTIKLNYK